MIGAGSSRGYRIESTTLRGLVKVRAGNHCRQLSDATNLRFNPKPFPVPGNENRRGTTPDACSGTDTFPVE